MPVFALHPTGPVARGLRGRRPGNTSSAATREWRSLARTEDDARLVAIVAVTTFAALIWGVNTLFLLDVGLDIFEVMVANAAFTARPDVLRGAYRVVADTLGRRISYLLSARSSSSRPCSTWDWGRSRRARPSCWPRCSSAWLHLLHGRRGGGDVGRARVVGYRGPWSRLRPRRDDLGAAMMIGTWVAGFWDRSTSRCPTLRGRSSWCRRPLSASCDARARLHPRRLPSRALARRRRPSPTPVSPLASETGSSGR